MFSANQGAYLDLQHETMIQSEMELDLSFMVTDLVHKFSVTWIIGKLKILNEKTEIFFLTNQEVYTQNEKKVINERPKSI